MPKRLYTHTEMRLHAITETIGRLNRNINELQRQKQKLYEQRTELEAQLEQERKAEIDADEHGE